MKLCPFISLSLPMLLGLISANAHGSGQPPLQVEIAILLNENDTPRCRIGQYNDVLPAELDTLRECNQSDELYARMVYDTEETSLGMTASPGRMVITTLASVGIMGSGGCIFKNVANGVIRTMSYYYSFGGGGSNIHNWEELSEKKGFKFWATIAGGMGLAFMPTIAVRHAILAGFTTTNWHNALIGLAGGGSFFLGTHCNSVLGRDFPLRSVNNTTENK